MLIVLFNGAPKVGKSTLASEIDRLLWSQLPRPWFPRRERHIDILRDMLFDFANRFYHEKFKRNEKTYLELKDMEFFGRKGREWQIAWGQGMRELNPHIFSLDLMKRIDHNERGNPNTCVYLVDDWGFPNELSILQKTFGTKNIITVFKPGHLHYTPKPTLHGDVFEGDSRINQIGSCDLVDPGPAILVEYILKRIDEQSRQR